MDYNIVVMETFGQWLRRHRKALNLTQGDVAKRANVSVSYVSTLERKQPHSTTGEDITPDRDKLIAIAKAVQGDVGEALSYYGYALNGEPQKIAEFAVTLKKMGVADWDIPGIDLEKLPPEALAQLLDVMETNVRVQLKNVG
jgi:transcriptional regulator with XRE-family HTH domain